MSNLKFNYRTQIDATPEDVFAYVSDLTRHGEWSEGLRVEATTDGPMAVGSQYQSVGKLMGKDVANSLRVTEYNPPTRMAFIANDGKADFLQEFDFRAQNGGTLLERTVSFQLSMPMALVFRLMIGPLVANPKMNKALKSLKARMEQAASSSR